jgi:hypothetical protein
MGNFCFGDQPQYKVLDFMDIEKYRSSIRDLPNFEVPRLFFLNNNADITYRKREANELLLTI